MPSPPWTSASPGGHRDDTSSGHHWLECEQSRCSFGPGTIPQDFSFLLPLPWLWLPPPLLLPSTLGFSLCHIRGGDPRTGPSPGGGHSSVQGHLKSQRIVKGTAWQSLGRKGTKAWLLGQASLAADTHEG